METLAAIHGCSAQNFQCSSLRIPKAGYQNGAVPKNSSIYTISSHYHAGSYPFIPNSTWQVTVQKTPDPAGRCQTLKDCSPESVLVICRYTLVFLMADHWKLKKVKKTLKKHSSNMCWYCIVCRLDATRKQQNTHENKINWICRILNDQISVRV